jgi:hypothetical protein
VSAEVDGEELVVLNNIVLLKVSAEVTQNLCNNNSNLEQASFGTPSHASVEPLKGCDPKRCLL